MSVRKRSDIEDVRHDVTVRVDAERAYHFFLEQFPSWWPRNFRITKRLFLVGIGAAVLVGTVSGAYPAVRASRLPPMDALRAG